MNIKINFVTSLPKIAGQMVSQLQNRSWFPAGVSSLVNVQRQFFDSFVGQTCKVISLSFNLFLIDIFRMLTNL